MVSRSILGRILVVGVLIASLAVIAQAALMWAQSGARARTPSPVAALPAGQDPASATKAEPAAVRVVYPASGGPADPEIHPKVTLAATSLSVGGPAQDVDAAPMTPVPGASPTPAPSPTAVPATAAPPAPALAASAARSAALEAPARPPVVAPTSRAVEKPARQDTAPARGANGGIDINRASIEELNHLPGAGHIGQTIARHRPYASVEDLMRKRVLRRSVYEQIKSQLAAE